jgi:hypothetical protein
MASKMNNPCEYMLSFDHGDDFWHEVTKPGWHGLGKWEDRGPPSVLKKKRFILERLKEMKSDNILVGNNVPTAERILDMPGYLARNFQRGDYSTNDGTLVDNLEEAMEEEMDEALEDEMEAIGPNQPSNANSAEIPYEEGQGISKNYLKQLMELILHYYRFNHGNEFEFGKLHHERLDETIDSLEASGLCFSGYKRQKLDITIGIIGHMIIYHLFNALVWGTPSWDIVIYEPFFSTCQQVLEAEILHYHQDM